MKVQAFDLRNQTLKEQEEAIQQFKAKDRNKGFDLSKDTLIRLALFRLDEEKHRMIWSFHHILLDGWSLGLVLRDLFEAYRAILSGGEPNRKPSPPFSRFIRHLKRQDTSEAASFWKGLLEGKSSRFSSSFVTQEIPQQKWRFTGSMLPVGCRIEPTIKGVGSKSKSDYEHSLSWVVGNVALHL